MLSQILTALFSSIQSYFWWGSLSVEVLWIGAVDALLVPLAVVPIVILFMRQITKLENEISERRSAQERLLESERKLRDFAALLPQSVFEIDGEGMVTYVNRFAEQTFGYTQEDIKKGMHTLQFISPEEHERARENMALRYKGELQGGSEYTGVRKDGSTFPIIVYANPIIEDGRTVGLRGILIDISDRKKWEEQMIRNQKLESLGLLAAGVAHDFNNYLAVISANLHMLKRNEQRGEKTAKNILDAEKVCLAARELSQQLITYARGEKQFTKVVSVKEVITESSTLVLRGSRVKCRFDIPDDLWNVEADSAQMSQVFGNLINNAEHAMPEGGTVRIQCRNMVLEKNNAIGAEEGKYLRISLEDSGAGIEKENLPKIFDPYFTTKEEGSGLGLAIVHAIVMRHNGFVTVESEPGKGTSFHIYLPASEKKKAEQGPESEETVAGSGKVLVMEDEELLREITGEVLTGLGYEVFLTKDGTEAAEAYQRELESDHPFDAVLLDLTVPEGVGGEDTLKKLREIDPSVKAIACSGYTDDPVMTRCEHYGFLSSVIKPYNISELSRKLFAAVNKR